MKIKAVCEQTGLSDRAVRFYMDEGLISPSYTENYLGRKTFDFSEADVKALQDIATLRKFGFSIEEIRRLKEVPGSSGEILPQIRQRKEQTIASEQEALSALLRLDESRDYDVAELAEALAAPAADNALPAEDQKERVSRRRLLRWLLLFGLCALPALLPWFWFSSNISSWSGVSLTRELARCGCLMVAFTLFVNTELQAALLRLAGTLLVSADYVLAYLYFPERGNIAGGMDLTLSSQAVHWTYWLAFACILYFLVRTLLDFVSLIRKKE